MKKTGICLCSIAVLFLLALPIAGCMGPKEPLHGTVDVDVTDSAALEYLHVYVTITKIEFHPSADAGIDSAGWQTVDISSDPVTVDLAQLANGRLYADTSAGNKPLFSGNSLPADTYRQIRLYLAATGDAVPAPSARALGLHYNNQATLLDGSLAPIRIPDSAAGIKIVPEAPLVVTAGKRARLALDFNLMDDMITAYPGGQLECILTPRLGYFDMDAVGAVKGKAAFGNLSSSYLVVLAEQAVPGNQCRVVRRATTVDQGTGVFNLYPLQVFGNNSTAVYDLLLRGKGAQTTIVKGVTVHKGTSPLAGASDLGAIPLSAGGEFQAQLLAPYQPAGAWLSFYQALAADPVPFEIYSHHLNPYTGMFTTPVGLSSEAVRVYDFSGGSLSGPVIDPTTRGSFSAVRRTLLLGPSAGVNVVGAAGTTVTFTPSPL